MRTAFRRITSAAITALLLSPWAGAAISVHFDSPSYTVQPGDTLQVQILYDADPNTPGDQPIAGGLFREGFLATYHGVFIQADSDVALPSVMTSPVTQFGSIVNASNNSFDVAAQEDAQAAAGYLGTVLATATMHNTGFPGTYTMTLGLNNSGMPNFLDYPTRSSQDTGLTFGTATVTITPEPAGLPFVIAALVLLRRRRPTTNRLSRI